MNLMTMRSELLEKLPNLYDIPPNFHLRDIIVRAKFFDPCGRYTAYVLAQSGSDTADIHLYCFVVGPFDEQSDEYGDVSLRELNGVKGAMGLGIERDLYFKPQPLRDLLPDHPKMQR